VLQFRAVVNFDDGRNAGAQDLSVVLTDGNGTSSSTLVSASSGALYFPPGNAMGPPFRAVPKIVLSTVRLPLSVFVGVDLTNITSVKMSFDQTATGALMFSDLAFSD
jgi:hypothetical protein